MRVELGNREEHAVVNQAIDVRNDVAVWIYQNAAKSGTYGRWWVESCSLSLEFSEQSHDGL
jgi:hypothetical protein